MSDFCQLVVDASPPEDLPAGAALPTSVALPAGAGDQDEVGRRNSVGKSKGKGKKCDNSPPTESDLEVTIQMHYGRQKVFSPCYNL